MKEYNQLRQETIEAINDFHAKYPNHKYSELANNDIECDINFTGCMPMCSITETQVTEYDSF